MTVSGLIFHVCKLNTGKQHLKFAENMLPKFGIVQGGLSLSLHSHTNAVGIILGMISFIHYSCEILLMNSSGNRTKCS